MSSDFFKGKRVLITGHSGFKGAWLCNMLNLLGSDIYGFSLDPPSDPNLYDLLGLDEKVTSQRGDISNYNSLFDFYSEVKPDIVIHMAAQPIVREGYRNPRYTYNTNVMGTVNILECVKEIGAKSFLNVTTDKVYENTNVGRPFIEDDRIDGSDPYSNSKSCSELVTHTYVRSFPKQMCPVSTARAGNVIGGGDFSSERIIPDCVRSAVENKELYLRNPDSIRPYQHVLEPLYAYLRILSCQACNPEKAGSYNVGPNSNSCSSTINIVRMFFDKWGTEPTIRIGKEASMPESMTLRLDNTKIRDVLGIEPQWDLDYAVTKVVEWTKEWVNGSDVKACVDSQTKEYLSGRGIHVERRGNEEGDPQ